MNRRLDRMDSAHDAVVMASYWLPYHHG